MSDWMQLLLGGIVPAQKPAPQPYATRDEATARCGHIPGWQWVPPARSRERTPTTVKGN